jgi:predicted nucleic acid-binding protein
VGWLEQLHGKDVCLDTSPIIYYVEKGLPGYKSVIDPFFEMFAENEFSIFASVIALLEGLVVPIRNDDKLLIRRYRNFFYRTQIQMVEINKAVAEQAAQLRATHNLFTPDTIQVATALYIKADFFLTNDKKLASIPGLNALVIDDLKAQSNSSEPKTDL